MTRLTFFRLTLITILLFTALGCNLAEIISVGKSDLEPTSPVVLLVTATPAAGNPAQTLPVNPPAAPLVPSAGLTVLPCPVMEDCPGSVNVREFYEITTLPWEYSIEIPSSTRLLLTTGWTALTEEIMAQNRPYIDFTFEIDGEDYFSELYTTSGLQPDPDDPSKKNAYYYLQVVISGWVPGEPHTVRIGYTLTADINDGWDDFEQGFNLQKTFHICPDGGCPPAP